MTILIRIVIACFVLSCSVYGQVTLHTGESWSYEFNTLPLFGSTGNPGQYGRFSVSASGLNTGEQLRIQVFENSLSDAPSATWDQLTSSTLGLWQDRQGAVRVTSLVGTFNIDSVTIEADLAQGGGSLGWDIYKTTIIPTSVPEPSGLVLAGFACIVALWRCAPRRNIAARSSV